MARPTKKGLDYFPFETALPEDDKVKLIRARFGLKGYAVYTLLLCRIYRDKGYYCNWGEDEALLFSTDVGDGVTHGLVNDLVQELFKRDLLCKVIFERYKILTSKGIQERYQYICKQLKRPFEIDERFDIRALTQLKKELTPNKEEFSPEETTPIREVIPQRKGKEIKEKESEWRARTIENEAWIDETGHLLKKSKAHVIAFCEKYIKTKILSGALENYSPQALTGFMMTDLEKDKTTKNGNGNGEIKHEHGKVQVGNID